MARGKKTSMKDIYLVMASYAITNNYSETARILDMPCATVQDIVKANKDKDEFLKLRQEKCDEFAEKASVIIDELLERIREEVGDREKEIPLHHLTTALGTMFDKRALSRGDSTQNIDFATNFDVSKLIELAGYQKKDDD